MVDVTAAMNDAHAHATGQRINNMEFGRVPYLSNVIGDKNHLITLLAEVPQTDREAINDAVKYILQEKPDAKDPQRKGRTGMESFVPPDLFSAFTAMGRNMDALNGFLQKAVSAGSAEAQTAAPLELAQGYLHWEPFDQFRASAMVLREALDRVYPNSTNQEVVELKQTVKQIINNCGEDKQNDPRLDFILSGRGQATIFDGVCIKASDDLAAGQSVSGSTLVTSPAITLEGSGDKLKNSVIRKDMQENVRRVVSQIAALSDRLSQFQGDENITKLTNAYADQCTFPDGPDLHGADLISALSQQSAGVRGLDITLQGGNRPVTGDEQLTQVSLVAENPWEAVNALRMPVRALSAILSTLNGDGRYDDLLRMANEVTGKCWRIQKGLGLNESLARDIRANAQQLIGPAQGQGGNISPVR